MAYVAPTPAPVPAPDLQPAPVGLEPPPAPVPVPVDDLEPTPVPVDDLEPTPVPVDDLEPTPVPVPDLDATPALEPPPPPVPVPVPDLDATPVPVPDLEPAVAPVAAPDVESTPPALTASPTPSPAPPSPVATTEAPEAKTSAPPLARRYWPGLDGLRALAIIGVLLYHAGIDWVPGGFLGVDLFFVISGFLITTLLIEEIGRRGAIDFAGFYRRRARRLLPALFALLLASVAVIVLFWPQELPRIRGDVVASFAYVTNWWFIVKHVSYFQATGRPSAFQHLWSLAVEEQFYLVWPAVVGLVLLMNPRTVFRAGKAGKEATRKLVRRMTGLGILAIVAALVSTAWMAIIAIHTDVPYGADASRVYMGTDTHAMGVLLGAGAAALACAWHQSGRVTAKWDRILELAGGFGLAGVCLAMLLTSEFTQGLYRGGFLLFAILATLPVLAVSRMDGRSSKLGEALGRQPLRWIGTRSYALYLWHWPIFVFTRPQLDIGLSSGPDLVLRLALTALAAEASYRLVEQPIRKQGLVKYLQGVKRIPAKWRPSVFAYGSGALIAIALAAVLVTGQPSPNVSTFFNEASAANARAVVAHPAVAAGVQLSSALSKPAGAAAGPPVPATPPAALNVTAVGDSVMLGAASDLEQAIPNLNVDAIEGRQAPDAFAYIDRLLANATLGQEVVIQVGTNGTIDPGTLNAVLDRLAGRRVLLLTVHVPRPWQDHDNATLAAAARSHASVELVDWSGAAAAHPEWFWGDGIHLRPAGAQAYTALVVSALK